MPENPTETPLKPLKLAPKTLNAIKLVNDYGEEPRIALEIVNNKKVSAEAVWKFKQKLNKYVLNQPKVAKLAHAQVSRILKGEPRQIEKQAFDSRGKAILDAEGKPLMVIETIAPTDTNIISAASMYYDRAEPVIKHNINVDVSISPVDMSKYYNGSPQLVGANAKEQIEEAQIVQE